MEPKLIPITALKGHYAAAIMNNQKALNFTKNTEGEYDAYIDEEELKAILKFFGAKDISELLANPKNENVGLDTFEKENENNTEIASEKPDTQEEKPEVTQADQDIPEENPESEEKNTKPDIKFNKKLTFNTLGSGAQTLTTEVAADLSLASIGTPFGGLYRSLQNEKADAVRNGGRTTEIDNKLKMIEDSIIDISNLQDENNEILLTESSTTQFTYGKDGSKTGIHTWEISTFGNNAMYDKDTPQANEEDEESEQDRSNQADYTVKITSHLITENADVRTRLDVGTDNYDACLSAGYTKQFDNGSELLATAQGRATIEPGHTNGSGGASLDYKNGNLNFGGMGYYEKEVITDKYDASNYRVEGYAKYDNKLRLAAGTEGNETVKYYYAKLDYNGNRTVENSNLQFTGALSSEIGRYDVDFGEYGSFNITNIELKARGGVYFKADDISASLNGNFGYGCAIDHSETDPKEKYIQNVNASLFGSVAKGRVRVSTMLSVFKDSDSSTANTSANVTVEYKNLREGLTPFLYYTVNNMLDGRQHEVGGGLGLKF